MRGKKRRLILFLSVFALLLTGCGTGKNEDTVKQIKAFTVGDETVYLGEVWIYAKTIQQEYEKNYGTGIWTVELQNEDGDTQTVETITKEDIVEEILQVKVLCKKAESYGVALTQEEQDKINQQAQEFISGLTDADKAETGVTQELAVQVYQENAIASKVYDRIMQEGKVEISDEQCRQTKIYDLYFPTYTEEGEGNFTPVSEEEKSAKQTQAAEAYSRITSEEDSLNIETAAYEYGCTESNFYTMSYEEYVDQYGQELADRIYAMKDGDYLGVVESQYGYHVIQMIALTDAETTQNKKQELETELRKEYFTQVYKDYLKEIDSGWKFSKNVNEDAWNMIQFVPGTTEE